MSGDRYGWAFGVGLALVVLLAPFFWAIVLVAVFLWSGIASCIHAVKTGDFPWEATRTPSKDNTQ